MLSTAEQANSRQASERSRLHIEVAQADGASCPPGDMHTAPAQCLEEVIRPVLQCLMAHLSTGDGPRKGCLGKAQLLKLPKGPMGACRKASASLPWALLMSSSQCYSSSCHDIKPVNNTPPLDMALCVKTQENPRLRDHSCHCEGAYVLSCC